MTDLHAWLTAILDDLAALDAAAEPAPWIVGSTSGVVTDNGHWHYPGDDITISADHPGPLLQPLTVRGTHIASKPAGRNGRMVCDLYDGVVSSQRELDSDAIAIGRNLLGPTVAAHRRLLALHAQVLGGWSHPHGTYTTGCQICADDAYQGAVAPTGPCDTVKVLALAYADRPGFDPAWVDGLDVTEDAR